MHKFITISVLYISYSTVVLYIGIMKVWGFLYIYIMCKYMNIIWKMIEAVSIILRINKQEKIPESIIGRLWSIIDLSLSHTISVRSFWKFAL